MRILTIAVLLAACGGEKKSKEPPPAPPPTAPAKDSLVVTIDKAQLVEALQTAGAAPKFGTLQVEEFSPTSIRLTHLSDEGGTQEEVQAIATRLVVATVGELKKRGEDPRRTEIRADVLATAPDGLSGGGRAALLGRAVYLVDADDVGFSAPPDAPFNPPSTGDPKLDAARIAVLRYAGEAFPVWQRRNPGACPEKLDDLNQLARRPDSIDPWGSPYEMLCGPDLPAGARPGVFSRGPDKKPGTADDVRSW